jgi:fibronectin-binding autotransporter adhesin
MQMKMKSSRVTTRASVQPLLYALGLMMTLFFCCPLPAADVAWDGGTAGTGTAWRTAANWAGDVVPGNTDNAIFDAAGTVTLATIDMGAAGGTQQVGSITLGSGRSAGLSIRNLTSSTANGTLILNGVGGVLLSSQTSLTLVITNGSSGSTSLLGLGLGASGDIYVANNGQIAIASVISDIGGARSINKTGGGTLYLRGVNTYSGNTTNTEGSIQVDATGTLGNGAGTLYLNGGSISCGADRSGGAPLANPVVMSADCIVINNAGLTGTTRTIPFSGSWSGTAGTLRIINYTGVGNQIFQLRMIGGFNFSRDVSIGVLTPGSFATLQLFNSSTNGDQTFSGVISDDGVANAAPGAVWRSGTAGSPPGTTSFTAANTYSGGTRISYGTLLANNATGSALGSGTVVVTNQGVLGGNGAVVATTHVGVESSGGTVSPGSLATDIGNLNISDLTLGPGATYVWQIQSVTSNAGVNQDLITCAQWTDAGSSGNPITVKVATNSAAPPTGWNSASAYDWVLIQSSTANGFDSSHFTVDITSLGVTPSGGFGLYVQDGALHLTYTPGSDLVIDVPSGSQTQAAAGHATLTGNANVVKIGNGELILDNAANDYSGLTRVLAGTASLSVDALNGSGALGANSSSTLLGNTTGNSNATLNIKLDGVTDAHNIIVQAGSSGIKTIGTTLTSGTASFAGDVALNDSASLTAPVGGSAVFTGNFSGSGGLSLGGGGTITLGGLASYSGPTTAGGVALDLSAKALGTNVLTINPGLTLDNTSGTAVTLNNCPQSWNADFSFTGTANLNLGAGSVALGANRTITVNSNTLTVGGRISGGFGLTKLGAGTLALTASTNCTYTGPTTNQAGVLAINGTATFGDGAGLLVLSGGRILNTGSRSGSPIANPVLITADTLIYGNSTDTASPNRYLPMTGPFTVSGGSLKVGNIGSSNTVFTVRLQGPTFSNINWPIVVGDTSFDSSGAISQLDLANDNTSATQFVNTVISGSGIVRRSWGTVNALNTGGTTVFNTLSTFSGGGQLISGSLGFGTNSISSAGVVTAGPVGTGLFTIGNQNNEAALGLFAYGGSRVIENDVWLNGPTNIVVTGPNNLTFSGPINMGGISKNWDVEGTGLMTLSGQITNSASGTGGFSKTGPGTLVFGGDNLYVGATTVLAGKLLANNTTGSGTSTNTVYVLSGGTLGGSGAIAGLVVVTNGSIAPGNSAGTLTLAGGVDLSNDGTYVWDLAANSTNNPGSGFDVLATTGGSVILGGTCQLSINFTGSATAPDSSNPFWQTARSWKILSIGGSASNPGPTQFPAIVNGSYSAGSFTNYADASGNIILAFTPNSAPPPPRPLISSTIAGAGTASAALTWSAVNGVTYTVQCKTNLNQLGWLTLGTATAAGTTATYTDNTGPHKERYYRIVWP